MSSDLIPKLKPWVTTFSEAIRYKYQHKDELRVGGKIVRIFNLATYTLDSKDMAYITLDDDVGEISLMVPSTVYDSLDKEYSFKEGMVVLADGKLLDPNGTLKQPVKSKKTSVAEAIYPVLVCWNIEPYKENVAPTE